MSFLKLTFILAIAIAAATMALAAPPAANHPIIGTWKITAPDGKCAEIYQFRPDGTTRVTSGEEVAESVYTVSPAPSAKGFYKVIDKVIKDNGKPDCSGEITKPSETSTRFILFQPAGQTFDMCQGEAIDSCIGPFMRLRSQDS